MWLFREWKGKIGKEFCKVRKRRTRVGRIKKEIRKGKAAINFHTIFSSFSIFFLQTMEMERNERNQERSEQDAQKLNKSSFLTIENVCFSSDSLFFLHSTYFLLYIESVFGVWWCSCVVRKKEKLICSESGIYLSYSYTSVMYFYKSIIWKLIFEQIGCFPPIRTAISSLLSFLSHLSCFFLYFEKNKVLSERKCNPSLLFIYQENEK